MFSTCDYAEHMPKMIQLRHVPDHLHRTLKARARPHPRGPREGGASGARAPVIVVDASAVLEVLLNTPAGGPVARRLFRQGETLHAPHLIDLEIAQVPRRYARAREIDPGRGRQAIA